MQLGIYMKVNGKLVKKKVKENTFMQILEIYMKDEGEWSDDKKNG
jgi:hypothetical protein